MLSRIRYVLLFVLLFSFVVAQENLQIDWVSTQNNFANVDWTQVSETQMKDLLANIDSIDAAKIKEINFDKMSQTNMDLLVNDDAFLSKWGSNFNGANLKIDSSGQDMEPLKGIRLGKSGMIKHPNPNVGVSGEFNIADSRWLKGTTFKISADKILIINPAHSGQMMTFQNSADLKSLGNVEFAGDSLVTGTKDYSGGGFYAKLGEDNLYSPGGIRLENGRIVMSPSDAPFTLDDGYNSFVIGNPSDSGRDLKIDFNFDKSVSLAADNTMYFTHDTNGHIIPVAGFSDGSKFTLNIASGRDNSASYVGHLIEGNGLSGQVSFRPDEKGIYSIAQTNLLKSPVGIDMNYLVDSRGNNIGVLSSAGSGFLYSNTGAGYKIAYSNEHVYMDQPPIRLAEYVGPPAERVVSNSVAVNTPQPVSGSVPSTNIAGNTQIERLANAIANFEGYTSGASRYAVEHNNPGNLAFSRYLENHYGATSGDSDAYETFARFETPEIGFNALRDYIRRGGPGGNQQTIEQFMRMYSATNQDEYIRYIERNVGISRDTRISELRLVVPIILMFAEN